MTYVWAHRGASGYAPENTMEAFRLAAVLGADGIELDVQLTNDGKLVVCHDETIDRTSDGHGFVKDYSLEELKKFNFNSHNASYAFCCIPTLEEVFELIEQMDMTINIELKTGVFEYKGIEEKVVELVDRYHMSQRVIYSSFNHYSILRVKKLRPEAKCGFLHADKIIDVASYTKQHGIEALHPAFYFLLDPNYFIQAKENGLLINAWTINEVPYMKAAFQLGINAVITNYPDVALDIRDQTRK